ncbi:hypothetical protein EGR_03949 [Echinococcus granulosus]|uniref:Uncharacterized protein n=1 Tax=Echinococcus granulosus TaxID=6210 RepID=W6V4Y4_ECHGR|nr:hypothetical protein EGR_03949 [Echinococcus granulosus]EUB61274.1 hypothetical protein EGR_03949 [Echinococcus granulosus]
MGGKGIIKTLLKKPSNETMKFESISRKARLLDTTQDLPRLHFKYADFILSTPTLERGILGEELSRRYRDACKLRDDQLRTLGHVEPLLSNGDSAIQKFRRSNLGFTLSHNYQLCLLYLFLALTTGFSSSQNLSSTSRKSYLKMPNHCHHQNATPEMVCCCCCCYFTKKNKLVTIELSF